MRADLPFTQPLGVSKGNDVVPVSHAVADDRQGPVMGHIGSLPQRPREAERQPSLARVLLRVKCMVMFGILFPLLTGHLISCQLEIGSITSIP